MVLTSTVTDYSRRRPYSIFDVKLKRIHQPVLIVHHKHDECYVTLYQDAKRLKKKLKKSASKVELLTFEGGDPPRGRACGPLSYHGFLGIESQVVEAIADWIKRN